MLILAGLKQTIDVENLAKKWVDNHAVALAAKSPQSDSARRWIDINVRLKTKALEAALKQIYGSGWAFGDTDSEAQLYGEIADPWANWHAGNEAAAALVDPPKGLKNLLDKSGTTIDGIVGTTLDELGTQLAASLSQGLGAQETANNLSSVVDNPARAMVIARTETARAVCDSNVANYTESGITQMQWVGADPCKLCQLNDGVIINIGETFPTDDEYPPAHPNCVCDVSPIGNVDKTINKYSEDQPRDSHGRFGSGGLSSENSNEALKQSPHGEALEKLWHRSITTTADGMGGEVAQAIKDGDNTYAQIEMWCNDSDTRMGVKATVANDLLQQDSMKAVATEDLIKAASGGFGNAIGSDGAGTPSAGKMPEEWTEALTPQQDSYVDENDEYHGINVVELNAQGQINIYDHSDISSSFAAEPASGMTVALVQQGIDSMQSDDAVASSRWAVAGTPEAEALVREAATSTLVNQWAQTSNDSNPCSLAMQQAAAEQFNLENYAEWRRMDGDLSAATTAAYEANGDVYGAFLQAQYDNTQAQLKAAGIESLTVYRGSSIGEGGVSEVTTRPMSSWSTSFDTATRFTSSGLVYRTEIPASQILSTAGTGFGCLNEFEVVGLGGNYQVDSFKSLSMIETSNYMTEDENGNSIESGDMIDALFEAAKK